MIPDYGLSCSEFGAVGLTLTAEVYDKLRIYSDFLVEYNENVNLTAITEPKEILRKHFIELIVIRLNTFLYKPHRKFFYFSFSLYCANTQCCHPLWLT